MSRTRTGPPEATMTGSQTRRASLLTLLATAVTPHLLRPSAAVAGKRGQRKARQKARQKEQERCQAQVEECRNVVRLLCRDRDDPEGCAAPELPCCGFLEECDATSMITCIFRLPSPDTGPGGGDGARLD
jgi:hypothetical protein